MMSGHVHCPPRNGYIRSLPLPFEVVPLKIYLDSCCYGRPYDDQTQERIREEATAKMAIQRTISSGIIDLISSEYLIAENNDRRDEVEKQSIETFIYANSKDIVESGNFPELLELADRIALTSIKPMDSRHVASAMVSHCDYFITTDDRILKYRSDRIKIVGPREFARGEGIGF